MTNELADKAHEVRILELEVQKLELDARIKQLKAEPIIDEECVGCCKVVDVAARLQKELDEYKETIWIERIDHEAERKAVNRKYCDAIRKQKTTIEELKDKNIEDMHELYDLYEEELRRLKHVISARDLTIKSLTTMCQSSGAERNKLASTIEDLEAKIKSVRNGWLLACDDVRALDAKLSARKEGSEMLMKVVEIIKDESVDNNKAANLIANVVGYFDAPEGPEDTPIDEDPEITVTFAWLELP